MAGELDFATNVDLLISHVITNIGSVSVLIDNGDDPSHALKILLANARYTQLQFREQFVGDEHLQRPLHGESNGAFYPSLSGNHAVHSDGGIADSARTVNSGYLGYRGRVCEACDDD
jgi:hypothetical protein